MSNGPITPPSTPDSMTSSACNTPSPTNPNEDLMSTTFSKSGSVNSGGAKKVNVEVIMKSNPFRVGK